MKADQETIAAAIAKVRKKHGTVGDGIHLTSFEADRVFCLLVALLEFQQWRYASLRLRTEKSLDITISDLLAAYLEEEPA